MGVLRPSFEEEIAFCTAVQRLRPKPVFNGQNREYAFDIPPRMTISVDCSLKREDAPLYNTWHRHSSHADARKNGWKLRWSWQSPAGTPQQLMSPGAGSDQKSDPPDTEQREQEKRLSVQLAKHVPPLASTKVPGDGNCQFHALAGGSRMFKPTDYRECRKVAVQFMRMHAQQFAGFAGEDTLEYFERMEKDGEWGDHLTLVAYARAANATVTVHRLDSQPLTVYRSGEANVIHVAYINSCHYMSVVQME